MGGWPKAHYLKLLRASEGTLAFSLQMQPLALTTLGPRGGLWHVRLMYPVSGTLIV
jgi:hypothetical protein